MPTFCRVNERQALEMMQRERRQPILIAYLKQAVSEYERRENIKMKEIKGWIHIQKMPLTADEFPKEEFHPLRIRVCLRSALFFSQREEKPMKICWCRS